MHTGGRNQGKAEEMTPEEIEKEIEAFIKHKEMTTPIPDAVKHFIDKAMGLGLSIHPFGGEFWKIVSNDTQAELWLLHGSAPNLRLMICLFSPHGGNEKVRKISNSYAYAMLSFL